MRDRTTSLSPPPSVRRTRNVTTTSSNKGKGRASARYDPVGALLREKKSADDRGKGINALLDAEATVSGKDHLLTEMDEEEQDEEWMKDPSPMAGMPTNLDLNSSMDVVVESEDQERLLGVERGRAITNILASDRNHAEAKEYGISFWDGSGSGSGSGMDVAGHALPAFPTLANNASPVLKQIENIARSGGKAHF